jgi:hypothetical protein
LQLSTENTPLSTNYITKYMVQTIIKEETGKKGEYKENGLLGRPIV